LSEALQHVANVIGNMKDNPLSEFFHRLAYKKGRMVAITATARKIAGIIWNMLTKKQQFKYLEPNDYKEIIRNQHIKRLQKKIKQLEISPEELAFATI